jgi:hypothetical protein
MIKGKKYKENLPLQSANVKPTKIIESKINDIITFIEKICFGRLMKP